MKSFECVHCHEMLKGPNHMSDNEMMSNHVCPVKKELSDLDRDLIICVVLGDITEAQAHRTQARRNQNK